MAQFDKSLPYAQHINLNQTMWEQPPGSGFMYSGDGTYLGEFTLQFDGSYVLIPASQQDSVDLADAAEEAYLSQLANSED